MFKRLSTINRDVVSEPYPSIIGSTDDFGIISRHSKHMNTFLTCLDGYSKFKEESIDTVVYNVGVYDLRDFVGQPFTKSFQTDDQLSIFLFLIKYSEQMFPKSDNPKTFEDDSLRGLLNSCAFLDGHKTAVSKDVLGQVMGMLVERFNDGGLTIDQFKQVLDLFPTGKKNIPYKYFEESSVTLFTRDKFVMSVVIDENMEQHYVKAIQEGLLPKKTPSPVKPNGVIIHMR